MQEKDNVKKLIRGLYIVGFSIVLSIVILYVSNVWIFEIPLFDFLAVYNHIMLVFENIGSPYLKLKAYYPLAYSLVPYIFCVVYWLIDNDKVDNSYGNAAFAKETDFEEMGVNLKGEGVQLACLIKGKKRIPISTIKPLATLIVAPAGAGKTVSVALPNLFSLPNSCFVLDIKGELLQKSAGYRQKNFNNQILVFSPLDKELNTMYFNPFDNSVIKNLDFVEMMQVADQVAGTIFVGEKGKETDHWLVSAKTLFTFFALYNMQKHKHTTLGDLSQAPKKDYYDELHGEFQEKCQIKGEEKQNEFGDIECEVKKDPEADVFKVWLQQTAEDEELDDIVRNQARAYSKYAENEFASIKSTYDTYMKVFANPRVANSVSKMSFNYEDLREKKITLYVVVQTEDMDILAPLIRILVESLFKKLMKRENSDKNKFIYFILDEFIRFGKMSFLLEAPALCRSYGLVPIYITQSYEQIKKYYGDDDLKILRANAPFQVVFRMNSFDDAKTLSDMVGDYTRKKKSYSKDQLAILKKNNSISEEGYKLITPQDILSSPEGQVFVLIGGYLNRPIKAKANKWFENKALKGADEIKYDPNFIPQPKESTQAIGSTNNTNNNDSNKKEESSDSSKKEANTESNSTQNNNQKGYGFKYKKTG